MTRTSKPRTRKPSLPTAARLLPASLLQLEIGRLVLPEATASLLAAHELRTVADLLALPARVFGPGAWFGGDDADAVQRAIARVLREGVATCDPHGSIAAWADLRDELLGCLADDQRLLVTELVGIDGVVVSRLDAASRRSLSMHAFDERTEQTRARLHQTAPALLGRLRYEIGRDLAAADGILAAETTRPGSLLHLMKQGSRDPLLGGRLVTFCFPREFALHGDHLCAVSPRALRRALRELPALATQARLPLPVATLAAELAAAQAAVPHGLLLHLLRTELRTEVEVGEDGNAMVVPDPRSPSTRLVDLLLDLGQPTQLDDLVYAYRDRHRAASRRRIEQRLRKNPVFVMIGPSRWSLRRWHLDEIEAIEPLVDRVARRVCSTGERQSVAALLVGESADERTLYLVLDRLAFDPRVRLLGRGEVCPATHSQSRVLEQLQTDFRRAGGDVVTSLFVQNQPAARRRLVERLLRWNRLFVMPADDRIDVLANYPFNEDRMRRLLNLVGHHVDQHGGHIAITELKAVLDATDLGGGWLTPTLLADLLRRHGTFELLGNEVVCRPDLHLGASLLRTVRQALREATVPLSVDDVLQARPELAEFASCLHDLIRHDPLLQTPDGDRFTLL